MMAGLGRIVCTGALVLSGCGGGDAPATSSAPAKPSQAPPRTSIVATVAKPSASSAEPANVKAKVDGMLPKLRQIAGDEAIVKAIKAQNDKKASLEDIKKIDEEWKKATGVTPLIKPYLENDCAKALKKYAAESPVIAEAFAMDNLGGLVGSLSKTSDYWQGDEDKWTKSFASGAGAEFVDKPSFDESSQTYSVQVSLPVLEDGKAIGAITLGLNLDKL